MLVFELPLQICFLVPVHSCYVSGRIAHLLDAALYKGKNAEGGSLRPQAGLFRPYTFDHPYPLEGERVYRTGKVYTVRIRTISQELAEFFARGLPGCGSDWLQVLGAELRLIPRYVLERVHTLTPVVVKTKQGYWRDMPYLFVKSSVALNLS